jgi:hypothetical protein
VGDRWIWLGFILVSCELGRMEAEKKTERKPRIQIYVQRERGLVVP